MKTSLQRWSIRLAGVAVLSLLVTATGVQAAQAKALRLPTAAQTAQRQGVAAGPYAQLQLPTAAQTARHQGVAAGSGAASTTTPSQAIASAEAQRHALHKGNGYLPGAAAAQPASSGISAATAWIVAALAVVGALLVGAWALVRRRRQRGELASFCAQHPEDARCSAA
jgi:cobalamin biosynthesis Mg chelatase CobN